MQLGAWGAGGGRRVTGEPIGGHWRCLPFFLNARGSLGKRSTEAQVKFNLIIIKKKTILAISFGA